ncbi:Pyridoxal biosynthesis protein PDX1 [Platanthera guangdongensis]|uniref:Pyridoxal biosynthesis protein PDX1 n=1 Tax=Platanthera guangdongensis TaxID=2320717 RepID=A0ABR2LN64_9ASPA
MSCLCQPPAFLQCLLAVLVQAATHYSDPEILADVSAGLGESMVEINLNDANVDQCKACDFYFYFSSISPHSKKPDPVIVFPPVILSSSSPMNGIDLVLRDIAKTQRSKETLVRRCPEIPSDSIPTQTPPFYSSTFDRPTSELCVCGKQSGTLNKIQEDWIKIQLKLIEDGMRPPIRIDPIVPLWSKRPDLNVYPMMVAFLSKLTGYGRRGIFFSDLDRLANTIPTGSLSRNYEPFGLPIGRRNAPCAHARKPRPAKRSCRAHNTQAPRHAERASTAPIARKRLARHCASVAHKAQISARHSAMRPYHASIAGRYLLRELHGNCRTGRAAIVELANILDMYYEDRYTMPDKKLLLFTEPPVTLKRKVLPIL